MYLHDWYVPTDGSTDLYSTTTEPNCWTRMPQSTFNDGIHYRYGSQSPRTGNKFIGLFTYASNMDLLNPPYREYIEGRLMTPLVPGNTYCAEMYVSTGEGPLYAANKLGFFFRDTKITDEDLPQHLRNGGYQLPLTPQIVDDRIINDTAKWVRISGTYTPVNADEWFVIGNFFNDSQTETVTKPGDSRLTPGEYNLAYYFVDDVSVELLQQPLLTCSGQMEVCEGDTAHLIVTSNLKDLLWKKFGASDFDSIKNGQLSIALTESTEIIIRGRSCNDIIDDTVAIIVSPRTPVSLGEDTTICKGDVALLRPFSSYSSYKWSNNSNASFLEVDKPGRYSITVRNEFNCESNDDINVFQKDIPQVDLGSDTLVCGSYMLTAGAGDGDQTYAWSTNETTPSILINKAGLYSITAQNQCGETMDSIRVKFGGEIFIPNVVTPNGDNLNTTFIIESTDNVFPSLTIFNRWGQRIFSDSRYQNDWPSNPESIPSSDMYFYIVSFPGCDSFKGWLHIIKE